MSPSMRPDTAPITSTPVDSVPAAVAALACLAYLAAELVLTPRLGLPLDDSWIHLQFADRIARSEGLAYNSGRWVAGSTAPLWTALASLAVTLGAPLAGVKLLGTFFFVAAVEATRRLGLELGLTHGLARLAATLAATSPWLVWSALSGMEVTLFACLSLWGMLLHLRELRRGTGLAVSLPVLALAGLARPEGGLLFAAACADRLLSKRRAAAGSDETESGELLRLATALAAACVVVLPTLVFYRLIGDSFLPTTFSVKSSPDPDFLPKGRYLRVVLDIFFRSQPIAVLFAGAGAMRLLERYRYRSGRCLLPVYWLFGLPLAYSVLAASEGPVVVGNFGRYYFPLLPVVALLGVLGWQRLARLLPLMSRRLLVLAVLVPQLWGVTTGLPTYLDTISDVESSDVAAARWLAPRLPPQAVLAIQDIGALKYHLPNPVIDLVGIVNPEILPHVRARDGQAGLFAFLAERRPDYLVVFPEYYPGIVRQPGMTPVSSFAIEHNRTMAGDELVVFSTPWNDQPLHEPDP